MKKEIAIVKLKSIYDRIPQIECKGCAECCGPTLWSDIEYLYIKDYLHKHNMIEKKYDDKFLSSFLSLKLENLTCPYLVDKKCSIYPVRPFICRIFGTTKGLKCPQVNIPPLLSDEIIKQMFVDIQELSKELIEQ
jgi:Fe-S-cluster containining protein